MESKDLLSKRAPHGWAFLLSFLLHITFIFVWYVSSSPHLISMQENIPIQASLLSLDNPSPRTPVEPIPKISQPILPSSREMHSRSREVSQTIQKELTRSLKPKKQNSIKTKPSIPLGDLSKSLQEDVKRNTSTGITGLMEKAQLEKYKRLIINAISRQWVMPPNLDPSLQAELAIQLDPDGTVSKVIIIKRSGNPALDASAQRAVYNASPLPVPDHVKEFSSFRKFTLLVQPNGFVTDR